MAVAFRLLGQWQGPGGNMFLPGFLLVVLVLPQFSRRRDRQAFPCPKAGSISC